MERANTHCESSSRVAACSFGFSANNNKKKLATFWLRTFAFQCWIVGGRPWDIERVDGGDKTTTKHTKTQAHTPYTACIAKFRCQQCKRGGGGYKKGSAVECREGDGREGKLVLRLVKFFSFFFFLSLPTTSGVYFMTEPYFLYCFFFFFWCKVLGTLS